MSERGSSRQARRVVVTGFGPVTPVATGVEEFWSALLAGRSGIDFILCEFGLTNVAQLSFDGQPTKHIRKLIHILFFCLVELRSLRAPEFSGC